VTIAEAEGGTEGNTPFHSKELYMAESVYKVIELIGTSTTSWEKAAAAAVNTASQSLRDLRVAEITQLDMHILDGKAVAYRAKVKLSFKYVAGGAETESAASAEPAAKAPAKAARKAPRAKAAPAEEAPAPAPAAAKKGARKAKRKPAKG
jgi:dodecin